VVVANVMLSASGLEMPMILAIRVHDHLDHVGVFSPELLSPKLFSQEFTSISLISIYIEGVCY
jgi:hypothetical protein